MLYGKLLYINTDEGRLGLVNLQPSKSSERLLIDLGKTLQEALREATRPDEVELLLDTIGEYSRTASFYSEKPGRLVESLSISLNEAALYKHFSLKKNRPINSIYSQLLDDFTAELH